MTVYSEAVRPMAPLIEARHALSLDEVIIAQNQMIVIGQVLGAIGVTGLETVSSAAGAGNVGASTIGSASSTSSAVNGVYQIVLLQTSLTAEFEVIRPDGTIDGLGKVGTAYAGSINFTITAGGTPTIGDTFSVTVIRPLGEGGEQFEAWSPTAADGSQTAVAVALYPCVTGTGQTAKITVARRDCTLRASDLTWASGATAAQIANATLQLAAKSIVLR